MITALIKRDYKKGRRQSQGMNDVGCYVSVSFDVGC